MTISWCRCVLDMEFTYLTFSASPINSRTNKVTLRCEPLSPHLSASTGRCLSGLTIHSCTMTPLPAQQSLSKPDGKLVAIVQKQCGRLMTDAQGMQRRQRWALVWMEDFFFFPTRRLLLCASTLSEQGPTGNHYLDLQGPTLLTHIRQVQFAPLDTCTCDFSISMLVENRWDAAERLTPQQGFCLVCL